MWDNGGCEGCGVKVGVREVWGDGRCEGRVG